MVSEPSLTVESLAPVIAMVDPLKWKEVWDSLLPQFHLEVKDDIQQQSHDSAAYYINHWLNPSWREVYEHLYVYKQTSALEKAKPFLPSTSPGWCAIL